MKTHRHIYIGVGTNLGHRMQNISSAYAHIEENAGRILQKSSVYQSPPWGFEADQDFYNTVIEIESIHSPEELIRILKKAESLMGRVKASGQGYQSRLIDLDILDFDGQILKTDALELPHPNMYRRAFVLKPLQEICPSWAHPVTGLKITELLEALDPSETVENIGLTAV